MTNETAKVAIVTGASGGIGAATALRLASLGCNVIANYAGNQAGGEAAAAACRELGVEAEAVQGDVADDADCKRIAASAVDRWGRLDVLVNNAGVTKFVDPKDMDALDAADFQRIFGVNVTGIFQMTRAARSALTKAGGAVVNVSSRAAYSGLGSSLAYGASKGAVNSLTLGLAKTLAPEIRVNAVCPGFVDTPWMERGFTPEALETARASSVAMAPLNRTAAPEDIAEAIGWLALGGPATTGQLLSIDGGHHLGSGVALGERGRN